MTSITPESPVDASPLERVRSLIAHGRPEEGLAIATELERRAPEHPELLVLLGIARWQTGAADEALRSLERAVAVAPERADVHRHLGYVHHGLGDMAAAAQAFGCALERAPDDADSALGRAVALAALGRARDAITLYQRALAIRPRVPSSLLGLGNALKECGALPEAREAYAAAIDSDPDFVPAYNNLGNVLQELADFAGAEEVYRKAVEKAPAHADAWYNLGIVRKQQGRDEAARCALMEARALAPEDAQIGLNLASVLQSLELLEESQAVYEASVARVPADAAFRTDLLGKLHAGLADVHLQRGDASAAVDVCERYLAGTPGDATMQAVRAFAQNELAGGVPASPPLDFDTLIRPRLVDVPAGFVDLASFNQALSEHVCSHPTLAYAPGRNATRNGMHTGELLAEPMGPIAALGHSVTQAVEAYCRELHAEAPEHPLLRTRPPMLALHMWGVVMRAQGHQVAHIHPGAWLSGVYYPCVPSFVSDASADEGAAEKGGFIEFGETPPEFHCTRPMATRSYRPRDGLMVLFPAWFYHRTVPYAADETRISIAFDLVPG